MTRARRLVGLALIAAPLGAGTATGLIIAADGEVAAGAFAAFLGLFGLACLLVLMIGRF
jgi:hypothetical protein